MSDTNFSYLEASAKRKKRNQFISVLIIAAIVLVGAIVWGWIELQKSRNAERIKNALNSQSEPVAAEADSAAALASKAPGQAPPKDSLAPAPTSAAPKETAAPAAPPAPEPAAPPAAEVAPAKPAPATVHPAKVAHAHPPAKAHARPAPSSPRVEEETAPLAEAPKAAEAPAPKRDVAPPPPAPVAKAPVPAPKPPAPAPKPAVPAAPIPTPAPAPVAVAPAPVPASPQHNPNPIPSPPASPPAKAAPPAPKAAFQPEDLPAPKNVAPSEEGREALAMNTAPRPPAPAAKSADGSAAPASDAYKTGMQAFQQQDMLNAVRNLAAVPRPASKKRGDAGRDEYVSANFYRAIALQKLGHLSEAASAYQSVLEYEKFYPVANLNLGICYVELKQFAKANRAFEAVIRDQSFIDPGLYDDVMQRTRYWQALAWTKLYKNATDPDKKSYYKQQAAMKWKDYLVWYSSSEKYKNDNQRAENYVRSLETL